MGTQVVARVGAVDAVDAMVSEVPLTGQSRRTPRGLVRHGTFTTGQATPHRVRHAGVPKSRQTVPETHSEHDATTTGGRLEKQPLRKQVQAPFASVAHSDDAAHCWHVLSGAQRPLAQSPATRHLCPSAHGPQDPPQSMPVSLPFCRPSVHVGAGRRLRLCLRFLCFWCPAMAWSAPSRPSPPASARSAWRRERRWVRRRVRASNA